MAISSTKDMAISVATPDQLFNPPAINPFSEKEVEVLGESGLTYIVRQLQAHRRDWRDMRLLIRLPPDQITPNLQPRLAEAVRRYCRARIEDNLLEIRLTRFRSSVGLGILSAIVVVSIGAAYLLFTTVFAGASNVIQAIVAATISLFAWVSLWDPLEALIFSPIAPVRENFILRRITELEIAVEAETNPEEATDARSPHVGAPMSSGA
jgi:hypothetical protein